MGPALKENPEYLLRPEVTALIPRTQNHRTLGQCLKEAQMFYYTDLQTRAKQDCSKEEVISGQALNLMSTIEDGPERKQANRRRG